MDPYLWKRLWRRPLLSLCSLILSGVLCFLLCHLSGYQQHQQQELLKVQQNFDVLCVVSNRQGNQTSGLQMGSSVVSFATSPTSILYSHIRDLRIAKEFWLDAPALGLSDVSLFGVSSPHCADVLDPAMGGGMVCTDENFFTRDDYVCLVSQELYEILDDKTVEFTVTDPAARKNGTGAAVFTVAGYYPGTGKDVYMPFAPAMALAQRLAGHMSCTSLSFLAADNTRLDALEQDAMTAFGVLQPGASEAKDQGVTLTIHDEQYQATVAALEQNIRRIRYLLPLVALLGLCVGLFTGLLSARGQQRSYGLMRTLGMPRGKLFASVFREQLTPVLLAAVPVILITGKLRSGAWYLIFHICGCLCGCIQILRKNTTKIIWEQE